MDARLSIEAGEGAPAVVTLAPDRVVTLGRNRGNTVLLQDRHASRFHAEIVFEDGRWVLRDSGTLNGTKHNGERLHGPARLAHGDVIGIGDTRLRFLLGLAGSLTPPELAQPGTDLVVALGKKPDSGGKTVFLPDELTALCTFMQDALKESAPRRVVALALTTLLRQTRATAAGYLGFDHDDPLPRLVLPELAHVDIHLSRQLTQRMLQERRVIWLGGDGDEAPESVVSFQDAVCLPLPCADGRPCAAIHVYKVGEGFRDREVRFCEVVAGYLGTFLQLLRASRHLAAENSRLKVHGGAAEDELIGDSPPLQKLRQTLARIAPGPGNVLITGESGSGKELVALALHRLSPRRDGPLVTVNCAAIPATLLEAELFGHRKGTFTGATEDRAGLFEQADEGTLFLDEIGELSPECQAKLLRVLEGKGFRPVGGTADVRVDVRIVAATNRDLEREVEDGRFREDLFYRLRIPVRVPPLREHAEDIPVLAEHFLRRLAVEYRRPVRLTEEALRRLHDYSWPGNVRQLRSVLENAVAMSDGDEIAAADLPLGPDRRRAADGLPTLNIADLEAEAIRQALCRTEGNKVKAAKLLDIHRDTLQMKIRKYHIERDEE